jgi:hypothetical protein
VSCLWAGRAEAAQCNLATSQGSTGPANWQTYCWLDFSSFNNTTARSAAGQNFSYNLPDGTTMTFNGFNADQKYRYLLLWFTELPLASCSCTTGCWASATPLWAVLEGAVVSASCAADPGLTATVPVWVTATPLIVADTVFDSATVELSVPDAAPLALVVAAGCVSVLPCPVALSTTVAPDTGFPSASRAVTVIVD